MNAEITSGATDREFEEENNINVRETIEKYLYHWPVFLLGILVMVTGAFLYLRYTQPIYEISSKLLIKDEKKGMPSDDVLSQLDLYGGSKKVVDNEIEILQSKALMRQVVSRLHLDVKYEAEGRVINSDLYDKSPVDIVTTEINPEFFDKNFSVSFPDNQHYILSEKSTGKRVMGQLGIFQRSNFGTFKINKTGDFSTAYGVLNIIFSNPSSVTDNLLSKLSVAVTSKQSTVLALSFQATVPQRGKDILNTLVQVYVEASLADKNRTTESTKTFIDQRLKLITGELNDVEKNIEGFKSSQGLTDISSEGALYLDGVKENDSQLSEVNIKLGVIRDMERHLNSGSVADKLPITIGMDDPVLQDQIQALSRLQMERERLLATTQPNNPVLDPINKQIEISRAGIRTVVKNIEGSLLSTKNSLARNNSKFEGSIKKIPGQERQFISIKRQQTIKENLYLYLLQKKEEAGLSYASAVADSRVVDSAFATPAPIKPKKQLTYMVAILLGLVLPAIYVYFKDLINNKVKSSSDLSKLTSAPILGELMYNEDNEAIVVQPNSRKAIAEQFRAIRTNLQYIHGKKNDNLGIVTLFTSSMSGEGKSFVGTNIATALAISGKKTVLLELDLRKPKVSKYLNLQNKSGLSNYLIGKAKLTEIIQPSGVSPNLMVISSGPVPPNPSELLIGKEIEDLFVYLRNNFDEIIIDTPPIGLVTDAQILARLADVSIYLVRHGVTFKRQITQFDQLYRSNKFPKLNLVLNGVQLGGTYGYGYGYGYYSDDHNFHKKTPLVILKDILKRF